ncbi:hypothetical protein U1Q18_031224, partial [Sarracenia purpurea var. burkii]
SELFLSLVFCYSAVCGSCCSAAVSSAADFCVIPRIPSVHFTASVCSALFVGVLQHGVNFVSDFAPFFSCTGYSAAVFQLRFRFAAAVFQLHRLCGAAAVRFGLL